MNPELVSSLLTAGSGLLGAVIGVVGALFATRQAGKSAFAQVRYGIQQQRISEVLNTTYDRLSNLFAEALRLSHSPPDSLGPGERKEQQIWGITEYFRASTEMSMYLLRNQLWMPSSIFEKARRITDELSEHVQAILDLLDDQSLADKELEDEKEKVHSDIFQVQKSLIDLSKEIAKVLSNEDVRSLDIPAFSPESLPEPDS